MTPGLGCCAVRDGFSTSTVLLAIGWALGCSLVAFVGFCPDNEFWNAPPIVGLGEACCKVEIERKTLNGVNNENI